jgi:hypothetical protein
VDGIGGWIAWPGTMAYICRIHHSIKCYAIFSNWGDRQYRFACRGQAYKYRNTPYYFFKGLMSPIHSWKSQVMSRCALKNGCGNIEMIFYYSKLPSYSSLFCTLYWYPLNPNYLLAFLIVRSVQSLSVPLEFIYLQLNRCS